MSEKRLCCVVMRINLDCNACCRKARRIILNMKEVEKEIMIDKEDKKVMICGRFRPSDVAIKLRKKMNRRVEILHVQDFDGGGGGGQQHDHATMPLLC